MATLTNQPRNTASLTNVPFGDASRTWDQSLNTWDNEQGRWDHQTQTITNTPRNTATLTNQAKS